RLERPRVGIAVGIEPRQVSIVLVFVVEFIILAEIIIYVIVEIRLGRLGFLLLGRLPLRQCFGLPAVKQRQLRLPALLRATFNFLAQTLFCEIPAAYALRVFLQVLKDAIYIPDTSDIVPHDGVKHVRTISPRRRTFTHDLLNVVDAVPASAAVKAVTLARRGL